MGITLEQLSSTIIKVKDYIDSNCLFKDNDEEYIPTSDYQFATKKYVDDVFNNNINLLKATVDEINRM